MPIPDAAGAPAAARELVRDRVYASLKEAILSGVLLPGERLDEGELRSWLQVSGTPIRQALHTLSLEGLVVTAPQSHSAVIAPRPEQALEMLQTIGVLVSGATLITLPRLGSDEREELATRAEAVIAALAAGDVPPITAAAEAYFATVLASCPNPVLVDLIARTGPSLGYHVSVAYRGLDADLSALSAGYETLRTALRNGDDAAVVRTTKQVFGVGVAAA